MKPSEIILKHFQICGIENPYAYLAKGFKASERTIRRYLKILDGDIKILRKSYVEKIIELSEKAMQDRFVENAVIPLLRGKK